MRNKWITAGLIALFSVIPLTTHASKRVVTQSMPEQSLRNEVENAIGKGLTWLADRQHPDGYWAQTEHPALSAMILTAFQGDPTGYYKKKYQQKIDLGYEYLLRNVKPDGSIYVKDLQNYNTSLSMIALVAANNVAYEPILKKARNYLIGLQDDFGDKGMGDHPLDGGLGYSGSYKNSDINNTTLALEALHYTRFLKSDVANDPEAKDLNWKAALQFITRSQNLPGSNDMTYASDDPPNRGGFVYFPENSMAGQDTLADGKVVHRSYGSASYNGLLSLTYAQVDVKDTRVRAVLDWLNRHYTLEENPGMGQAGLFYYYHMMAKGLSMAGVDTITLKDGKKLKWRPALAKRLLDLQASDGTWVNQKSARFWERDPHLVTAHAILALEITYRGL
ncbi:MAG: terpene cyclase/mutase family protein [Thiobacillaceae bacterium]|jgi:squalene-hopene/tetraprenyl-beta-curcumene cyclase|nr:terpene cyclase/mutase family protein [Thiobacillaceae bacterium]